MFPGALAEWAGLRVACHLRVGWEAFAQASTQPASRCSMRLSYMSRFTFYFSKVKKPPVTRE